MYTGVVVHYTQMCTIFAATSEFRKIGGGRLLSEAMQKRVRSAVTSNVENMLAFHLRFMGIVCTTKRNLAGNVRCKVILRVLLTDNYRLERKNDNINVVHS